MYSDSITHHSEHLREVLSRLRVHGLTVKPIKCQLFHRRVTYLGHLVVGGEVRPLLQVLKEFLRPNTKRQLMSFLGLSNYYRKYIEHYADKAHPLYDALKRNKPDSIVWNQSSERAFLKLKNELTEETILMAPHLDRSFILSTDASIGLGAVLSHEDSLGQERPVAFFSRGLNRAERNYSVTKLECLAVVAAVTHFSFGGQTF